MKKLLTGGASAAALALTLVTISPNTAAAETNGGRGSGQGATSDGDCGSCGEKSGPSESPSEPGDIKYCFLSSSQPHTNGKLQVPNLGWYNVDIKYNKTPDIDVYSSNSYADSQASYATGTDIEKFLQCANDSFEALTKKDIGAGVCVESITTEFNGETVSFVNKLCQQNDNVTPIGQGKNQIRFEPEVMKP